MKVILPVIDDQGARNMVAHGFHNARFVCVYDCENHSSEWFSIDDIAPKPGNLTLGLKRMGVYTVISPQMPLMALGLFVESGLTVYKAAGKNVEENIKLFLDNQLEFYQVRDSEELAACATKGCDTCSSSCN